MILPQRLLDGYHNFRNGRYATEAERYRKLGLGAQKPSVMVIACCDSRAAPETIFDAGPGEIFVVRNVANLVPPYMPDGGHHATSAALEFAILALGVKHVVVMGHGRCGGIHAAVQDADPLTHTDFIGSWMRGIKDVARYVTHMPHENASEFEHRVERASVEHSLANMRTFPWIRLRENAGQLTIHGAWFDISLGELHAYDETAKTWASIGAA